VRIGNIIRWLIAGGLLALSFAQASWLAPNPAGALQLIGAMPGSAESCAKLETVRRALIAGGGPVVIDADAKAGCVPAATVLSQLARYHFVLRVTNGAKALELFETLRRPIDERYAFMGDTAAMAAIRARVPGVWAFTVGEGRRCFSDYKKLGWLTIVPASCKNGTILVPIDQKWTLAGWPRRFQARMAAAGAKIILTGPGEAADRIAGLDQLEQIPQIPRAYTGYVWVDDVGLIGPSIRR
jgi:hypothetical protein